MSTLESAAAENLTNQDPDDIDEDDDQTNALNKVVTNIHPSSTAGTNKSNFDVQNLIKTDLKNYFNTQIPKDYSGFVQCHIKRGKLSLTKGFATTFSLYFDGGNKNDQTFLLIARKHFTIGGHSEYFIGINAENPKKNLAEENCIAKLRGVNISGTQYVLYDHQNAENIGKQSAAIIYDDHIFGTKEPRKLIILLPDAAKNAPPLKDNETILDQWQSGHAEDFIELRSKPPTFNEEAKVYTLNLQENRIKQPSHKNFQLVTSNDDAENNVAMQFGRIDDNTFALDYRYPLTVMQAFGIALSSFHNRFRT